MACKSGCKGSCRREETDIVIPDNLPVAQMTGLTDALKIVETLFLNIEKLAAYLPLARLGLEIKELQALVTDLRRVLAENAYLRRALQLFGPVDVTPGKREVTFQFGPENRYQLFLPAAQTRDRKLLAQRFRELAAELEKPVSTNNSDQTTFSFTDESST
jgi:hypothetical protein